MSQEYLLPFLKSIELFTDFTEEELRSLLPFVQVAVYDKGDMIIREGETGQNLYLMKMGTAEIIKEEKEFGHFQQLGLLEPGEWVGEMAHFEKEKRSASIRALERVEVIIFLLDDLEATDDKNHLYSKISNRLARKISQRLRKTDETLVSSLKDKLKILQTNSQITRTIIHLFIFMSIWFNVSKLIDLFPLEAKILDPIFTSALVILFGLSCVYLIRSSGYPLSFYGLTVQRWGKQILEAFLFSIPIMIFLVFLKWILITNVDLFKEQHLLAKLPSIENAGFLLMVGVYILLVPVQELVARGFLQSCFRNFFQGPDRVWMAILTSNLLFEMVHTVKNFWFAIATFFLGIFWGILYEQQKSIVGVSFSHAIIGGFAFIVLDYQTLFNLASNVSP